MSARYCILLPANTPLFAHILWAKKAHFSQYGADAVDVRTAGGAVPNDHLVRDAVSGAAILPEAEGLKIIAGVCDPFVTHAYEGEVQVLAAIVKRLSFLLASPHTVRVGSGALNKIKHISVDGQYPTQKLKAGEYPNSAWAVAHNFDEFMHSFASNTTTPHYFTFDFHKYGKCPVYTDGNGPEYSHEPQFVITSNVQAAIEAQFDPRLRAHIEPITNLFPEWAHLLLSALIAKRFLSDSEKRLLGGVTRAIEDACWSIHHSDVEVVKTELSGFYSWLDSPQKIDVLYDLLVTERFVPENLSLHDGSLLLNDALWQLQLHQSVVFRDARLTTLATGKASSGRSRYPNLNVDFLHWAKKTDFGGPGDNEMPAPPAGSRQ